MRMFLYSSTFGLLFFLYIPFLPSAHTLSMDNCFVIGRSQESIPCSELSLGPHFLISLTRQITLCPRYFPLDLKPHGANQNPNSSSSPIKPLFVFTFQLLQIISGLFYLSDQFPRLINSTFMTSISFMPFYSLKLS